MWIDIFTPIHFMNTVNYMIPISLMCMCLTFLCILSNTPFRQSTSAVRTGAAAEGPPSIQVHICINRYVCMCQHSRVQSTQIFICI